jgi:endonuclease/exonuclease/phosphatase family metal-dependent hydrolase
MAESKNKPGFFSRLLFGLLALVAACALLLSYAALVVNPAKVWFVSLFGLLYPLLLLLVILLLLIAFLRRSRLAPLLILALLPSVFLAGRYVRFDGGEKAEGPLKIVSYNVGLFAHQQGSASSRIALADSVAAYLRGTDADIICLQEFFLPNAVDVQGYLETRFPGYKAEYYVLTGQNGHAGNVTLSRYPILYKGKIDFEHSTNMALYTDINLDTTVVRIYNCHLESYNISPEGVIRSIGEDDTVVETTGRRMRGTIERRPAQVDAVVRSIKDSPVRSLVLGDFNDVPMSYTYQRLKTGRKDSFVAAGKGLGATFTKFRPFLRIDYILYPRDLEATSCEVPNVRYSDHYPVIATYR